MLSSYWTRVLTTIVMLAILAQSWNIITGFVGYPAFGNVAFFGVGAYTVGYLTTRADVPYVVALLAAAITSSICCLLLGSPLMRIKGHYFAIGTIGLAAALREVTTLVPNLSTGDSGTIILPGFSTGFLSMHAAAFYWMVGILVACVVATAIIDKSRFGYGLKSIRANETVAATCGVPVFKYKILAWIASAAFTGLAGGVWATWIGVIDPPSSFDLRLAVSYSVIALVGGLGTVVGPLLGAVLIGFISELVLVGFVSIHLLVMGLIIMVTTLVLPRGIMGYLYGEHSLSGLGKRLKSARA